MRVNVKDVRLILYSPIDLNGIPVPNYNNNRAIWLTPDIFVMDNSENVVNILFLDELISAPASVQAVAYQIALDKKLGDHRLPDNTFVIAAGNRSEDNGVINEMPSPLKTRFMHFVLRVDVDSWLKWATENGINKEIIDFISNNPDMLSTKNFNLDSNIVVTPRSWETLSKVINTFGGSIAENEILANSIVGKTITSLMINNKHENLFEKILLGDFNDVTSNLSLI